MRLYCLIATALLFCVIANGCSRRHYRTRADSDSYALLAEQAAGTPWEPPADFSVYPAPNSRLADPTSPDAPWLPPPGPVLFTGNSSTPQPDQPQLLKVEDETVASVDRQLRLLPPVSRQAGKGGEIRLARFEELQPPEPSPLPADNLVDDPDTLRGRRQLIPLEYWDALPRECVARMLEFDSVRLEFEGGDITDRTTSDGAQRYSLPEIIDAARLNSREFQTAKEALYVAALAVSLQRYDYMLKFSRPNSTDLDYSFARDDGATIVNEMRIPSTYGVEKMLATGGTLLARFSNEVLLNFNVANGFSSLISSDLFFQFNQNILQRDQLLEPLIQSERDLVYAARDFARFRKQFFFDLASSYYNILRTYRNIEIESQNYFSLVRTVEQAQAEVLAGVTNAPNPVAVDQYEQSMLSGRSELISTCNELETALDRLKIQMGLPTEMPINIDPAELNQLTLLDETEVAHERVRRWQRRVEQFQLKPRVNRAELLNANYYLALRLIEWTDLRRQVDSSLQVPIELEELMLDFQVDLALEEVKRNEDELAKAVDPAVPQPTILLYERSTDLILAKIALANRQRNRLARNGGITVEESRLWSARIRDASDQLQQLRDRVAEILDDLQQERLDQLLVDASDLLAEINDADQRLRDLAGWDPNQTDEQQATKTQSKTNRLFEISGSLLEASTAGLPAIDIQQNDAMLTALVQRLDLMNQRGSLADDWRQVKYAADNLRSVVDVTASHQIRTDKNNPFDFDFDDSDTNISLAVDLPLDRRIERNQYRRTQIDFQQGRRDLMGFEDDIKFDVRDGLRSLNLIRVQYPISVTQAALAAEQVISTRLQLALGFEGVRYTDLLLALQSSRESLRSVAFSRIGYLVQRAQFALDLELMQLDGRGFWPEINDRDYQPVAQTFYPSNAGPTYGEITPWVKPSKLLFHLYRHRLPGETVTTISDAGTENAEELPLVEGDDDTAQPLPAPIPPPLPTRSTETN